MLLAMMLLIITHPVPNFQRHWVDVVEVNDVSGRYPFRQIIVWRWMTVWPYSGDHYVSEYFMMKNTEITVERWSDHLTEVSWRGENGMAYSAICLTYRHTKTKYDPEVEDRKRLAPERRRPYFVR